MKINLHPEKLHISAHPEYAYISAYVNVLMFRAKCSDEVVIANITDVRKLLQRSNSAIAKVTKK